jgi:hypothetical protein
VFLVGPADQLDPARRGDQTACLGGENALLGRSIFGGSMIVPAYNRPAALKMGLCQVILVTRRAEADSARGMLAAMGVEADVRQN